MEQTRISLDIDGLRFRHLFLAYYKLRRDFPDAKIKVCFSSSGTGFHLKATIPKKLPPLEIMKIKAFLGDDPYRIRFELKKMYAGCKIVEICFNLKDGKYVPIENPTDAKTGTEKEFSDFPYEKLDSLVKYNPKEALEKIEKLAERYYKKYCRNKVMSWLCVLPFDNKFWEDTMVIEKIREICFDIKEKDESFKFKIYRNVYPKVKGSHLLIIFCSSKDEAHKKGTWFINKTPFFERYWVKEAKYEMD